MSQRSHHTCISLTTEGNLCCAPLAAEGVSQGGRVWTKKKEKSTAGLISLQFDALGQICSFSCPKSVGWCSRLYRQVFFMMCVHVCTCMFVQWSYSTPYIVVVLYYILMCC